MPKRTKIICTLGPSVDSDEAVRSLIEQGMDVARLNFSHGSHDEHAARIERVKRIRQELKKPVAIMLDTKGPEIRTGLLDEGEPVLLEKGQTFSLVAESPTVRGNRSRATYSYPQLASSVDVGSTILLDDGLIELVVERICGTDIICTVKNTATLGQRKSINIPGAEIPLPLLTEKDLDDVLFGIEQGIDFIALSFVRDGDEVERARTFVERHADHKIGIIAKIENARALGNIENILAHSDGIMVARGDLGVEVVPYEVPHLQKSIIRACNREHKPVIIATQMLESMTQNPRPTRAEATDVANAIYDGADAVMLSGETASGAYPIEALKTMVRIAETSEQHYFEFANYTMHTPLGPKSVSHAVGIAAVQTARDIEAKCIVCPTMTGRSARLISSLRPPIPIYAVSPDPQTLRTMQLFWGVTALLGDVQGDMRSVIDNARDVVFEQGFLEVGDIAVFTCGDRFTSPMSTNADGTLDRFSPANVMYVVQIRDDESMPAFFDADAGALMSSAYFEVGLR